MIFRSYVSPQIIVFLSEIINLLCLPNRLSCQTVKNKLHIESLLVKGVKEDDHSSFKTLFDTYSTALFAFSMSYLKSSEAAEDVVQEVFEKVWDNRKQLKTNTSFQSYLFTIALNAIRKHFNKLARLKEAEHDILQEFSSLKNINERNDFEELEQMLYALIDKMPPKRKQAFQLRKLEGKSLKEISEQLNVSSKTVEFHITESMKFLRKEFEKQGIEGIVFFYLFV